MNHHNCLQDGFLLRMYIYITQALIHTIKKGKAFSLFGWGVWLIEVGLNEDRSNWALRGLYPMKTVRNHKSVHGVPTLQVKKLIARGTG